MGAGAGATIGCGAETGRGRLTTGALEYPGGTGPGTCVNGSGVGMIGLGVRAMFDPAGVGGCGTGAPVQDASPSNAAAIATRPNRSVIASPPALIRVDKAQSLR
jgi:hypothetical protein